MKHHARTMIAGMVLACVMCGVAGAADKPADKPGAKPENSAGVAAIHDAAVVLTKQFQDYEKDQTANTLETECDYFRKNPNTDITQAQIISALSGRFGNDVPTDCYVKWQLLSVVVGKFDASQLRPAFATYQRAIQLPLQVNPGSDHSRLDQALARLGSGAKARMSDFNTQLTDANKQVDAQNHTILEYRDTLFSLLPPSPDVFTLGMSDVVNRMSRGVNVVSLMNAISAAITEWSVDASPADVRAVAGNLRRLAGATANPKSFIAPYFQMSADAGTGKVHWDTQPLLDPSVPSKLADKLEQDAANPNQLGFKKAGGN